MSVLTTKIQGLKEVSHLCDFVVKIFKTILLIAVPAADERRDAERACAGDKSTLNLSRRLRR